MLQHALAHSQQTSQGVGMTCITAILIASLCTLPVCGIDMLTVVSATARNTLNKNSLDLQKPDRGSSPQGNKPSGTKINWWRVTGKIALSVFICSLAIGYLLGRARSPKFDDPTESPLFIRHFIAEHVTASDWNWRSSRPLVRSRGPYTKVHLATPTRRNLPMPVLQN
jgi:hypothetical protein